VKLFCRLIDRSDKIILWFWQPVDNTTEFVPWNSQNRFTIEMQLQMPAALEKLMVGQEADEPNLVQRGDVLDPQVWHLKPP
jgi:hypothetical protein